MRTGKLVFACWLALATSGCVLVYAPSAERVAGQMHDQEAHYMPISQSIDPRLANEVDVTGVAGIKGDVGSGNKVASPAGTVKLK